MINPVLLLEDNPFHSLQEVEKDVSHDKMDSGLSPALFLKEHHVAQKSKDLEQVLSRPQLDERKLNKRGKEREKMNIFYYDGKYTRARTMIFAKDWC